MRFLVLYNPAVLRYMCVLLASLKPPLDLWHHANGIVLGMVKKEDITRQSGIRHLDYRASSLAICGTWPSPRPA